MKPYTAAPFTNSFGQTMNPGDKIIIITEGYSHAVKEYVGTYLGYREHKNYRGATKRVVCEVEQEKFGKWTEDGKKLCWNHPQYDSFEFSRRLVKRYSTLQRNRIFPFMM